MASKACLRTRAGALAMGAVLTVTAAACTGDSGGDLPPASPRPGDAFPASPVDPERREILHSYYDAVDAMVAAQRAGDPDHPDLARYLADGTPAIANLRGTIARNDRRGMYYAGELEVAAAVVTDIDREADPPEATIESCLDYTDYRLLYREDDSPVPDLEPLGRVTVIAQALLGTDELWYIATNEAHWDETC